MILNPLKVNLFLQIEYLENSYDVSKNTYAEKGDLVRISKNTQQDIEHLQNLDGVSEQTETVEGETKHITNNNQPESLKDEVISNVEEDITNNKNDILAIQRDISKIQNDLSSFNQSFAEIKEGLTYIYGKHIMAKAIKSNINQSIKNVIQYSDESMNREE